MRRSRQVCSTTWSVLLPGLPLRGRSGDPARRDNGSNDLHFKTEKGLVLSTRNLSVKMAKGLPLWSCIVRFGTLSMPVDFA
jgi:hypothetical protein